MEKIKARLRTLGPTQLLACLLVLPLTTVGALVLLWAFTRWNERVEPKEPSPEYSAIEQECVEAQMENPHQLSCDFGGLDDARAWKDSR